MDASANFSTKGWPEPQVFSRLEAAFPGALSLIAPTLLPMFVAGGTAIASAGDTGRVSHFVVEGSVTLRTAAGAFLRVVHGGGSFGEAAVLANERAVFR